MIKWNFNYTNGGQVVDIPLKGIYKLEVWGASSANINTSLVSLNGGYGGYSVGNIALIKGTTLYINVGGQGKITGNTINLKATGGYNGGGDGYNSNWTDHRIATSGGGATHIALQSGVLPSLSAYKGEYDEDLETYVSNDILIVAGGGGGTWMIDTDNDDGSWRAISSGSGGGYIGGTGSSRSNGTVYSTAGAKQKNGASFGQGQNAPAGEWGGGGGGFFGGSVAYGASGGSGYIGNPSLTNKAMYCYNCSTSNKESIKTISTNNVSGSAVSNYAKIGNGYARITFVSE